MRTAVLFFILAAAGFCDVMRLDWSIQRTPGIDPFHCPPACHPPGCNPDCQDKGVVEILEPPATVPGNGRIALLSSDADPVDIYYSRLAVQTVAPTDLSIQLNWNYHTFDRDGPRYDRGGYTLDGAIKVLTAQRAESCRFFPENLQYPCIQAGATSVFVPSGQTFGIFVDTSDNEEGPALFDARLDVSPVPEPSSVFLLLTCGVCMALVSLRGRLAP